MFGDGQELAAGTLHHLLQGIDRFVPFSTAQVRPDTAQIRPYGIIRPVELDRLGQLETIAGGQGGNLGKNRPGAEQPHPGGNREKLKSAR